MPVGVDALDQREQLLDQERREPERRLVEDQQLRLGHQAAADRQHLLLAAGERAGALRSAVRRGAEKSRTPCSRLWLAPRAAAAIGCRDRDSRARVMLGKMRRPSGTWMRPRATIAAGRSRSIAASAKSDGAAAHGAHHAGDGAVERRLAGAIGAQHGDDLALPHGEIDAAQNFGRRRSRRAGRSLRGAAQAWPVPAASIRPAAPWPR